MLTNQSTSIRETVIGLNEFLTDVYKIETRLSSLLSGLGFEASQIEEIRKNHLTEVVAAFVCCLRDRVLTFQGGERAYRIISRYYGLDGEPRENLQCLGNELSITRERVRQLKEKALRKCKTQASREFLEVKLKEIATQLLSNSTV